ncbi:toll/interleukin-1 receptor domain-containing protein [Candidatus Albibeggiatoa sp. nov. BB20]|uniref:toll/interleukin-1 receptor domain-containing protein n=1 Tax=Candidatus Albibeggiatoa sp. nov. BB20 TaxID=3162723 RepID=UPI0033659433
MPSFTQYEHDIFVSCNPIDNQVWIMDLMRGLTSSIAQKLGGSEQYSIRFDEQPCNTHVNTDIAQTLIEQAATFILILTANYLNSPRCQQEFSLIMNQIGQDTKRLFLVELQSLSTQQRPAQIIDVLNYRFWEYGASGAIEILQAIPEQQEYYKRLEDIAVDVVEKLRTMSVSSKSENKAGFDIGQVGRDVDISAGQDIVGGDKMTGDKVGGDKKVEIHNHYYAHSAGKRIFLAEVSPDLEPQRSQVKRYLEQHGLVVLPEHKTYLYTDAAEVLLQHDLAQSDLFVQLLDDKSNKYSKIQLEAAKTLQLLILQWCGSDLTQLDACLQVNPITDDLVNFQQHILTALQPKPEPQPNIVNQECDFDLIVFVHVAPEDKVFFEQHLQTKLDDEGVCYSQPIDVSDGVPPAEIRKDLEDNLLICHAVIVPYSKTPLAKIRQNLIYCQKVQAKRKSQGDAPIKVIAICDHPIPNKPPLKMKFPAMEVFACHSESSFQQLLRSLSA